MNGYKTTTKTINSCTYDEAAETAAYLRSRTDHRPTIGIICGSGLGGLAGLLQQPDAFEYRDIVNFPTSTVSGHVGRLLFGNLNNKCLMVMQGRFHLYEGYSPYKVTFPVRVMKLLGVKLLMVTNASGGLNATYEVGDFMVMKDHINLLGLAGFNPLVGHNDDRFGERFPAMSDAYDRDLRRLALAIAADLGFDFVREGVYACQGGPSFETVTECRLLRLLGADVTGMSSVPEVVVARHCGMRVFGVSLVTNKCVLEYDSEERANHAEVMETGEKRSKAMLQFMTRFIDEIQI